MVEPTASFESLLLRGALSALGLAVLWGAVIVVAVLLEAATDGRVRAAVRLGCPPRCHRWLLAAATGVLAATVAAAPATADERRVPTGPVIDGLSLPDRAPGELIVKPEQDLRAREPPPAEVTVLPGDSLWEISRRRLPAHASAGSIAALTRTVYAHNRTTIGADPDLIRPGQRLYVPF